MLYCDKVSTSHKLLPLDQRNSKNQNDQIMDEADDAILTASSEQSFSLVRESCEVTSFSKSAVHHVLRQSLGFRARYLLRPDGMT
jgi:hypothetical protein